MRVLLLARWRGGAGVFKGLLEGDPVAFMILGGSIVATGLVVWLMVFFMKRRGQKIADGIGGCTYAFSPDGLFGQRIFLISGDWQGVPFTLEARKTRKRGDYRTVLLLEKPRTVAWAEIRNALRDSRQLVQAAQDIAETPGAVALTYLGIGGKPTLIKKLLSEFAEAVSRSQSQPDA